MRTIEDDIAKMMADMVPAGSQGFIVQVVIQVEENVDHIRHYGPFDSWKAAADWNRENWANGGMVYPLFKP